MVVSKAVSQVCRRGVAVSAAQKRNRTPSIAITGAGVATPYPSGSAASGGILHEIISCMGIQFILALEFSSFLSFIFAKLIKRQQDLTGSLYIVAIR